MDSLLRNLYGHQRWADAQYWQAIEQYAPARADPAIRNRLGCCWRAIEFPLLMI
jgi:hypothetical protein